MARDFLDKMEEKPSLGLISALRSSFGAVGADGRLPNGSVPVSYVLRVSNAFFWLFSAFMVARECNTRAFKACACLCDGV